MNTPTEAGAFVVGVREAGTAALHRIAFGAAGLANPSDSVAYALRAMQQAHF